MYRRNRWGRDPIASADPIETRRSQSLNVTANVGLLLRQMAVIKLLRNTLLLVGANDVVLIRRNHSRTQRPG